MINSAAELGSTEIIAISSLGFNIIAAIIALTWGLGRVRDAVRDEIDKNRERMDADIDNMGRSIGETIAAMREKMREVELFGRDTYMRRDSFYKNMEMFGNDMKAQFLLLGQRLERMESKLDGHK